MKLPFLLNFIFLATSTFSQEKEDKKVRMSVIFNGGVNFENSADIPQSVASLPYGIDLAENLFKIGGYFNFGARVTFYKKFFLEATPGFRSRSRNAEDFELAFQKLYPDHQVYINREVRGVNRLGLQVTAGFHFYTPHLTITPTLSMSASTSNYEGFNYILRTMSTNYLESFQTRVSKNPEFPVSIGLSLNHPKLSMLELVTQFGFSNLYKKYSVHQLEVGETSGSEELFSHEIKRSRLFWSVGIRFAIKDN